MPFFKWFGADTQGRPCKGIVAAREQAQVSDILFLQGITCDAQYMLHPWQMGAISLRARIDLFDQIAALLKSGVRLYDTLCIVAAMQQRWQARLTLEDCARNIHRGVALSEVATAHPILFDPITLQVIIAGEQAGTLAKALVFRAKHLGLRSEFVQQLKQALFIPAIILIALVMVLSFFFVFVIPRFQQMFHATNRPLPALTQFLFAAADWLHKDGWWHIVGAALACFIATYLFIRAGHLGRLIPWLPVIGRVWRNASRAMFFQTWALLTRGGVPVVESLRAAQGSLRGSFCDDAATLGNLVEAGEGLAYAATKIAFFHEPEIVALLTIGETSGELAHALDQLGTLYQERTYKTLRTLSRLIQPLLILMLGSIIIALFIALYEPILSMTTTIG